MTLLEILTSYDHVCHTGQFCPVIKGYSPDTLAAFTPLWYLRSSIIHIALFAEDQESAVSSASYLESPHFLRALIRSKKEIRTHPNEWCGHPSLL